jgi:isopentenyl diphosphate isomerase/L-lactate dehydrogenase-like FMN-dependent dehydrogenase
MPGIGGTGTGSSFIANFDALAAVKLNMTSIHGASDPDTKYDFFGTALKMPILPAPLAGMKMNMGDAMEERDFAAAMVGGAMDAGSISFTADGPAPLFFGLGLELLGETGGRCVPAIKPRREEVFLEMAAKARDRGAAVIATDIDAAGIVHMRRAGQPAGPWPEEAWKRMIARAGVPVILKGVMTVRDAEAAVRAGAAGIVVSNHGGRVLDHTPGTAEVLPEIAAAVKGRIRIFADGGVRSGEDVLKMLALGAEAVLVGRPVATAAVGGGREGVAFLLSRYAEQLRTAMMYAGCASLAEISPGAVRRPNGA